MHLVMMPSCVPATSVDDNRCVFSSNDMYPYVRNPRILGLGEVMDDPAVIHAEESMFVKMDLFQDRTIDGHAPYLPNKELSAYKMAGVDTDHEATTFEYALEEVRRGLHVHVREGSAAHNLEDIVKGIVKTEIDTEYFSFCTDDKHIEDILRDGHIDYVVENGSVYDTLALPIMGLMSDAGFNKVNEKLQRMIKKAHNMGVSEEVDPFITLSFLAFPVIPELRITPRGLCKMTAKGLEILNL